MKLERYFNRFHLISELSRSGVRPFLVANGQAIDIGHVIGFSSGYAQKITSLQGAQVAGVALNANTAAEASAAGVMTALCIPILPQHIFAVPVEANALITQAAVGTIVDLQSANTIDIADAITLGYGFRIDAIDVSAEAIDANAYGFAIGHFEYVAAS
jgi:hypothetical protein